MDRFVSVTALIGSSTAVGSMLAGISPESSFLAHAEDLSLEPVPPPLHPRTIDRAGYPRPHLVPLK